MSNYNALFMGLEEYVDDASTTELQNTPDPSTQVEEIEKSASDAGEITQACADMTYADNVAQAIFRRYDALANMLQVAKTQGINGTFLALANTNEELSKGLNINLPSCESISSGTLDTYMTSQVIAGLEGVFKDIWEWIKKTVKNIVNFFKRLFTAVATRISSIESNIIRVKKALKEKTALTGDKIEGRKFTSLKGASEYAAKFQSLHELMVNSMHEVSKIKGIDIVKEVEEVEKRLADFKDQDKKIEDAVKEIKIETEEKACSDSSVNAISSSIDGLAAELIEARKFQNNQKELEDLAKFTEQQANRYSQLEVKGDLTVDSQSTQSATTGTTGSKEKQSSEPATIDIKATPNPATGQHEGAAIGKVLRTQAATMSKATAVYGKYISLWLKYITVGVECCASWTNNAME